MASQTYDRLVGIVEPFIGRSKAEATIARQLTRCNATADSLTSDQAKKIRNYISGAARIQLAANKARQDELEEKLLVFFGG